MSDPTTVQEPPRRSSWKEIRFPGGELISSSKVPRPRMPTHGGSGPYRTRYPTADSRPARSFWERCSEGQARFMAGRALQDLRERNGGPFTDEEVRQITADIVGYRPPPGVRLKEGGSRSWGPSRNPQVNLLCLSKEQCRTLILKLIVLGLA